MKSKKPCFIKYSTYMFPKKKKKKIELAVKNKKSEKIVSNFFFMPMMVFHTLSNRHTLKTTYLSMELVQYKRILKSGLKQSIITIAFHNIRSLKFKIRQQ